MEKVDILIIGAGAVGLAVAYTLANTGQEIVVLERHHSFGQETSSRNSEVLHGGMYYPPDSLKTRLCTAGNRMLYEFSSRYSIPCIPVGKLIIAIEENERAEIEALYANGIANGVPDLSLLTAKTVAEYEPHIRAGCALYSKTTGIFDSHRYMQVLEKTAAESGVIFAYGCTATGIQYTHQGYRVAFTDTDDQEERITAQYVINCAGLAADTIAGLAGIDIVKAGYKLAYSKGEYFNITGIKRGITRKLIYPVPGADSLGIHTVLDLQGGLKLGPNAYYVQHPDYTVDETHKTEFYHSVEKFLPFVRMENLVPGMAGIRPKLQKPGGAFADFVICHEKERGLPGLVNLIGIESPGLTASLAIAQYVKDLL